MAESDCWRQSLLSLPASWVGESGSCKSLPLTNKNCCTQRRATLNSRLEKHCSRSRDRTRDKGKDFCRRHHQCSRPWLTAGTLRALLPVIVSRPAAAMLTYDGHCLPFLYNFTAQLWTLKRTFSCLVLNFMKVESCTLLLFSLTSLIWRSCTSL